MRRVNDKSIDGLRRRLALVALAALVSVGAAACGSTGSNITPAGNNAPVSTKPPTTAPAGTQAPTTTAPKSGGAGF